MPKTFICNVTSVMFSSKDDEISPLEEALTTQVVHQLKDKGHGSSTSWGEDIIFVTAIKKLNNKPICDPNFNR